MRRRRSEYRMLGIGIICLVPVPTAWCGARNLEAQLAWLWLGCVTLNGRKTSLERAQFRLVTEDFKITKYWTLFHTPLCMNSIMVVLITLMQV